MTYLVHKRRGVPGMHVAQRLHDAMGYPSEGLPAKHSACIYLGVLHGAPSCQGCKGAQPPLAVCKASLHGRQAAGSEGALALTVRQSPGKALCVPPRVAAAPHANFLQRIVNTGRLMPRNENATTAAANAYLLSHHIVAFIHFLAATSRARASECGSGGWPAVT